VQEEWLWLFFLHCLTPFFFLSFISCIPLYPIFISCSYYVTALLSFLFSSPWHYNIPSFLLFYPFLFLYGYILPSFLLYSFSYSFYLSVLMLNFSPHCNSKTLGFPSVTDYHYLCRFSHHVAGIAYCVACGFFQEFSELHWMLSVSIVSVWYFIFNVTILMWSKQWNKQGIWIIDFKLLPYSVCCMFSSGKFPGVWILYADVLEHSVSSIFIGRRPPCWVVTPFHYLLCNRTYPYPVTLLPIGSSYFRANLLPQLFSNFSHFTPTCLWTWNRQSVPKRRHIKFRRRGITQKKTYNKVYELFSLTHQFYC